MELKQLVKNIKLMYNYCKNVIEIYVNFLVNLIKTNLTLFSSIFNVE